MKHATKETVTRLEPVLKQIRKVPNLIEKTRGIFYRGSSAFLHFHEDPAGIFADVKLGAEWQRLPVNNARDRSALLRTVRDQNARSASA